MKRSKRKRQNTQNTSDSDSSPASLANTTNTEQKITPKSPTTPKSDSNKTTSAYQRRLKKREEALAKSPLSSSSSDELPVDPSQLKEEVGEDSKQCRKPGKNLQKKKGTPQKNRAAVGPTLVSGEGSRRKSSGVGVESFLQVTDHLSSDAQSGKDAREKLTDQTSNNTSESHDDTSNCEAANVEDSVTRHSGTTAETTCHPPRSETNQPKHKEKKVKITTVERSDHTLNAVESQEGDVSSCASVEDGVSNIHITNKPSEARFITIDFDDEYHGIVVLSSREMVAVHGCVRVAVVVGHVDLSGYISNMSDTTTGSDEQQQHELCFHDIYSSNTSSLLNINDLTEPASASSDEVAKSVIVERLSHISESFRNNISDMLETVENISSCLLIRKLYTPMVAVMKKLENFNGLPLKPKFFGPPFDTLAVLNTASWKVTTDGILGGTSQRDDGCLCSAMLCGVGNVGKSSLARYMVNRMLAKHKAVYFLDCDCGQTEFTPPSCLSLVKVTRPLLGPPFSHQTTPLASYFYGQISPGETPREYIKLISELFHVYHNEHRTDGPLVINTQGWMQGLGLLLLVDVIRLTQPCHIVHITSPQEKRNVPVKLSDELLESQRGFYYDATYNSVKGGCGPRQYHELPITQVQTQHTHLRKYKSRVSRDQAVTSYFSQLYVSNLDLHRGSGLPFEDWIPPQMSTIVPYMVHWGDVALHAMHENITSDVMLFAFNLSLVSLVHVDPQLVKPSENLDSVRTLIGHPVAEYIGFGIVRNIDPTNKLFYVLTPVPKERLEGVNALVRGSCQLPTSYFLEDKKSDRPYYCADYINVASKVASGMKPRYNLKRKPSKIKASE